MSKWTAWTSSNTMMVVAAVAFAIAAVGAGLYINNRNAQKPGLALVVPATSKPVVEVTTGKPDNEASPSDKSEISPSIDEVRFEADGLTILAGRASPGSKVSIFIDGVENISVTVDNEGNFAAIMSIQPKTNAQVLTIVQTLGDEVVVSLDEIILAPISSPVALVESVAEQDANEEDIAISSDVVDNTTEVKEPEDYTTTSSNVVDSLAVINELSEDKTTFTEQPTTTVTNDKPALSTKSPESVSSLSMQVEVEPEIVKILPDDKDADKPPVAEAASGAGAVLSEDVARNEVQMLNTGTLRISEPVIDTSVEQQSVVVLKSTKNGVEMMGPSLGGLEDIAIDTIGYSNNGDVQLTGRAQSDSDVVRVYINNQPIIEMAVDSKGRWRGNLPSIDTGVYTLRVDEIDGSGGLVSSVETPFKREDPEVLAEVKTSSGSGTHTVQTGHTLWAIARERYGEGILYVQIHEANKHLIGHPDLIYPGQVFAVPD